MLCPASLCVRSGGCSSSWLTCCLLPQMLEVGRVGSTTSGGHNAVPGSIQYVCNIVPGSIQLILYGIGWSFNQSVAWNRAHFG
eukprot:COSAG01_NODE_58350_length_306_cov_1.487923_1_plen_82_part_01